MSVEFVTGSISAPGLFEAASHNIKRDNPLRSIYLYEPEPGAPLQSALNFSMLHGVRASLTLQSTQDRAAALRSRNAQVSPHLSFLDWGGHGYSAVRVTSEALQTEFVGINRPIERSTAEDGGPLVYRVTYRVPRWSPGETPRLERVASEGTLPLGA